MRLRHAIVPFVLCSFAPSPVAADPMAGWAREAGARIGRYLRPPSEARYLRSPRVALIRFVVDGRGRVSAPEIVESTGYPGIDQAAIAAVTAASPLPAPPMRKAGDTVLATLPISFNPSGISVRPLRADGRE